MIFDARFRRPDFTCDAGLHIFDRRDDFPFGSTNLILQVFGRSGVRVRHTEHRPQHISTQAKGDKGQNHDIGFLKLNFIRDDLIRLLLKSALCFVHSLPRFATTNLRFGNDL